MLGVSAPFSAMLIAQTTIISPKRSSMGMKAEQRSNSELDHIRDTLTDVVGVVGETRQDVKILDGTVGATRQDVKILDGTVGKNHKEICERLDQLELLIRQLLPNANN